MEIFEEPGILLVFSPVKVTEAFNGLCIYKHAAVRLQRDMG